MEFLSGWINRKSKQILGSTAGNQTNYPISITLHKGIGIDTTTDIFLNNKCKNDFSDIRFTKADGVTLLDYWIESFILDTSAVIWVEINLIQISPNITLIYLYYNNPLATSLSNGTNTFLFFDDFLGVALQSSWTNNTGVTVSVANSLLTLTTPAPGSYSIFNSFIVVADPIRIRSRVLVVDGYGRQGKIPPGTSYQQIAASTVDSLYLFYQFKTGVGFFTGGITQRNVWYLWDAIGNGTNRFQLQDNLQVVTVLDTQPQGNLALGVSTNPQPSSVKFDWTAVLKYIYPEPTLGITGTEEITSLTLTYLGSIYLATERGMVKPTGASCGRKRLRNR